MDFLIQPLIYLPSTAHIMDNTCLLIEPRDEDTDATFVMVNSVRDGTQDGNCNAQVGYNTNPGARTMHLGMNCFVSVLRSQNEHRLLYYVQF